MTEFTFSPRRHPDLDESTYAQLSEAGTSTLGHLRDHGFITHLQPIRRPIRLVGRAVTVRIGEYDAGALGLALELLEPGDVLVVAQAGAGARASIGGIVGYRIAVSGAAGLVVDGAITDHDEIADLGLPVYYRAISPRVTRRIGEQGEASVDVAIGETVVHTGDIVVGDSDGLVVLSPQEAPEVAADLVARQAREPGIRAQILQAARDRGVL